MRKCTRIGILTLLVLLCLGLACAGTLAENSGLTLAFNDESAYDSYTIRAAFVDNEGIGLYHCGWIRNYQIDSYDELAAERGGEPVWSAELVGDTHGARIEWDIGTWAGSGKRAIDVGLSNEPSEPCTLYYKVTCTWGEETITGNGTLEYVTADLPVGLAGEDDIINLQVEKAYGFNLYALPTGYTFGDFIYAECWTNLNCDNWDEWGDEGDTRYILPHEAGIFQATLALRYNNVQVRKDVFLCVEDENGNLPTFTLNDSEHYTQTRAAFKDNSKKQIYHDAWVRDYSIRDYDASASFLAGEPEWSVEWIGDSHGANIYCGIATWYGEGSRAIYVNVENEPTEACSLNYRVTCTWGGATVTCDGTMNYVVPKSLPKGLDIQARYDGLKVGETFALPVNALNGYSFGEKVDVGFDRDYNCENWWEWVDGQPVQFIVPHEAGILVATVRLTLGNISIQKQVQFFVEDENGNVPLLTFTDSGAYDWTMNCAAFADNAEIGLCHREWIRNYVISGYEAVKAVKNGQPVWSAELVGETYGATIAFNTWDWEGENGLRGFDVNIQNQPSEPCTLHYTVTCSWDGDTITANGTVNFIDMGVPTGANIPDTVDMTVNQTTSIPMSFIPDGFSVGDGWVGVSIWIDGLNRDNWCDGHTQYITPYNAGTFNGYLGVCSGNVEIGKSVTFRVADENGNVPLLTFTDSGAYDWTVNCAAFADNADIGLVHREWMRNYVISGYEAVKAIKNGQPVWSAELVGETYGATIAFNTWDWEGENGLRGFDVNIQNQPSEPCTLHYVVTCSWDGDTITANGTVNFIDVGVPTGAIIPDTVDMTVNQTTSIPMSFIPDGFSVGDGWDGVSIGIDGLDRDEWCDGHTQYITPYFSGTFSGYLGVCSGNVEIGKSVTFRVADENGIVPGPQLSTDYYFNMSLPIFDSKGFSVGIDRRTLGFHCENRDEMLALYGDDYDWSFETISGSEADVSCAAVNDYFELTLHNLYDMEENTDVIVRGTLRWGNTVATTNFHFHIFRLVMPDQINFEHVETMKAGGVQSRSVSISPANWDYPYFLYYDFSNEDLFEKWNESDNLFSFRAKQKGYYTTWPHLHVCDNVYIFGAAEILPVADKKGKLPAQEELALQSYTLFDEYVLLDSIWDGFEGTNDLHTEDRIADVWIDEDFYAEHEAEVNSDPIWMIEQTQGEDFGWYYQYEGNHRINLWIWRMPEHEMDAVFTVTCMWGNYIGSREIAVRFVNHELPTGFVTDDVIELTIGQRKQVNYTVYPDNWSYTADRSFSAYTYMKDGVVTDGWGELFCQYEDGKLYVTANDDFQPGTYTGGICLRDGSVNYMMSPVTFIISEGGGPVTSVTFDQKKVTLNVGQKLTLKATVSPDNASDKSLKWKTSDKKVATVSSSGKVTAVGVGTAKITATAKDGSGKKATCTVTVIQPVTSIVLDQTEATLKVGESLILTETVSPEDATNQTLNWSSSDAAVATVDDEGKVTAVGVGSVKITAAATDGSGVEAVCEIEVIPANIPVTSVKLNNTKVTLSIGGKVTLKATVSPDDATDKSVKWKTSNKKVATVTSSGKVTAVGVGTAKITATAKDGSGKKATCTITVIQPVTSIELDQTEVTLKVGESVALTADVSPDDATNQTLNWSSSDTAIATVDADGNVTAVGAGSVKITAAATDGSGVEAVCEIEVIPANIPVTSVKLNNTKVTLNIGGKVTLKATVSPDDATNKSVKWKTSNKDVATVNSSGKVTAVGVGTAKITATAKDGSGKKATCTITVIQPVTSVELDQAEVTLKFGESVALIADVSPDDATIQTLNWSSSDAAVATVDADGIVTAVGVGTAKITATATDGSKKADFCDIEVIPATIPVKSVKLNKTEATLSIGGKVTLKATVSPDDATDKSVKWKTSDKNVATVSSSGKVTAVGVGTATITATARDGSGKKATCTITVINPVTSITLNKTKSTLSVGGKTTLKATVSPDDATNPAVEWTSSDTDVAKVSSSGKVTAVGTGTATITATARDGSGVKATCKITVK